MCSDTNYHYKLCALYVGLRLTQGIPYFQHAICLYHTHINAVFLNTNKKTDFIKLTHCQQQNVQIFYTQVYPNRRVNVENVKRNSFMSPSKLWLPLRTFSQNSHSLTRHLQSFSSYRHTYIPWISKCVIKTAGCATSHTQIHKCTN